MLNYKLQSTTRKQSAGHRLIHERLILKRRAGQSTRY